MNFVIENVSLFLGCGHAQLTRCLPQILGWFDLELTDRAVTMNRHMDPKEEGLGVAKCHFVDPYVPRLFKTSAYM